MSRNIVIIPNRGLTGSTSFPRINFSGLSAGTIALLVDDNGDVIFDGDEGGLFSISDNKDGLLHSVNDVTGMPIISVYDFDLVTMGTHDDLALAANGNQVFIGGITGVTGISSGTSLYVSGDTIFNGNVTGNTFSAGTIYVDDYIDFLPQTTLPSSSVGRLFFSGSPLFRLMQNTGGTASDWIVI